MQSDSSIEMVKSPRKRSAAYLLPTDKNGGSWLDGSDPKSSSVFHHIRGRTLGHTRVRHRRRAVSNLTACRLPHVLAEREIDVGRINKIFAAEWISDHQVVVGTKCNSLIALDLKHDHQVSIPMLHTLPSKRRDVVPANNSGIHSIAVNPSGTLLATGADNPNNIGVYRLPTFDPVCVGQDGARYPYFWVYASKFFNCHEDWMFSVVWLDDQYLVAGSRDSQISVWSVGEDLCSRVQEKNDSMSMPSYEAIQPLLLRNCVYGDKVRALEYSPRTQQLASLSANGYIHLWDLRGFHKLQSRRLPYCEENVCISFSEEYSLYAVGSQSHVSFLDAKSGKTALSVHSREKNSGVRSVSFKDALLTVGTGLGALMFFDIRANQFLKDSSSSGKSAPMRLCTGKGYLNRDSLFHQFFSASRYPNAVYTHKYDPSGTRLFLAGGPLPSGLSGNYVGVWQ